MGGEKCEHHGALEQERENWSRSGVAVQSKVRGRRTESDRYSGRALPLDLSHASLST